MLRIGTIGYLHMFNIEDNLKKLQRISEAKIVRITSEKKVKGGKKNEQYMEYECESIYTGKIYKFNNYLCPFSFTSLQEIEVLLNKLYEEDSFDITDISDTLEAIKNKI